MTARLFQTSDSIFIGLRDMTLTALTQEPAFIAVKMAENGTSKLALDILPHTSTTVLHQVPRLIARFARVSPAIMERG